ncbi:beta-galactosidase-1-like protein 2 [Tribolium madens]|uniref:beta-galactosidase-1-like protein 2 n=1 Tax=Tribolium madens TaxID=41895 RepID=UPI001CF75798|nr:beta-galactosidase-1-like protein 2 [Tribolium madens]
MKLLLFIFPFFLNAFALPTLYEYYTSEGITEGLSANQTYFTLNGKNITIYSGTMHYFRIPPQYWRDRLRKLRAAGLNTVETYVPWNLHEPQDGVFDFGGGGTDFEAFLDVHSYLKMAQEEDLFVIVRPGPFICAEWEFGGLPSWLLKNDIMVRTSDPIYIKYVRRYFDQLLPILAKLQFTQGGPIIALQVENEYGSSPQIDLDYIKILYDYMRGYDIVELLVTSDGAGSGTSGSLPELLFQTVNFGSDPKGNFDTLRSFQPGRPIMAMEYWTGWFDHWSENHHTVSNGTFNEIYEQILTYPASVNMYMFHGGTNFGFLNGANIGPGDNSAFQPTTTSYDYDAPLAENGDYTGKYEIVKSLIKRYNPVETSTPEPPELIKRQAYSSVEIQEELNLNEIIDRVSFVKSHEALPMEKLPINNNSGQSFGYLIYRIENLDIAKSSILSIKGHVRDTVMVLINGVLISKPLSSSSDFDGFGYWKLPNSSINLTKTDLRNVTLDLVFENWGRGNFGNLYHQRKGLTQDNQVYLNDIELNSWTMFPLEFKKSWTENLTGWRKSSSTKGPGIFRAILPIENEPKDTYIDMQEWNKGIVIVNGFVVGRYAFIGPQQALYLPAPFLKQGDNEIIVFEHFQPAKQIKFSAEPIFKTP